MFEGIQRLRGVAALAVFIGHAHFIMPYVDKYFSLIARTGVEMFFVISGFVICKQLINLFKIDSENDFLSNIEANINYIKCFFIRRIYRLFPNVLLFTIIDVGFLLVDYNMYNVKESIIGFLSYLSLKCDFDAVAFGLAGAAVRHNNHFWSLVVEERFYLIFPFVFLFFKSWRNLLTCCAIFIVIIPIFGVLIGQEEKVIYNNGFVNFYGFLYGVLLFLIYKKTNIFKLAFVKKYNVPLMNAIFLLILGMLFISGGVLQVDPSNKILKLLDFGYGHYVKSTVYFLSTILVLLAVQNKEYAFGIPGIKQILNWFGDRSYTIYVFHLLVIIDIMPFFDLKNDMEKAFFYIVVTLLSSEIIYQIYEKPLRNKGRQISNKLLNPKSSAAMPESSEPLSSANKALA